MKGLIKNIPILLIATLLCSCDKELTTVADYIAYVEAPENGLSKSIEVDGWRYRVLYKPSDYVLANEHNDKEREAVRREQLEGVVNFNVYIQRADGRSGPLRYKTGSREEYEQRYNYYLNAAPYDIALVYGSDTLSPVSYLFETSYNLAPQEVMVIGFALPGNAKDIQSDLQFVYRDRLFNNGIIKATFFQKDISSIPPLKTSL